MTTAPGPVTTTRAERGLPGGVGDSPARPDGTLKVKGEFAYSSDLWHEDMLWGMALRAPHPAPGSLSWTSARPWPCPVSPPC